MSQPRKLFEEVAEGSAAPHQAPETGMIGKGGGGGKAMRRTIRLWLLGLLVLVALTMVAGGLIRPDESGLSERGPGLTLLIMPLGGLVWAAVMLFFWLTRRIPAGWGRRLLGIGVLGGVQAAVGWWLMAPGAAAYIMAIYLGLSFAVFGLAGWYILALGRSEAGLMQARRAREGGLFAMSAGLMHLAFVQILLGALLAGSGAGQAVSDWPLMGGRVFPPDAFALSPLWRNFVENAALLQFAHRVAGYVLVGLALFVWARARRSPNRATRRAFSAAAAMLILQMLLGIFTVLYAAPLHIAISHLIGALLAWVLILNARHQAGYPVSQSIRG